MTTVTAKRGENLEFYTPPFFRNRHVQTLLAILGTARPHTLASRQHYIPLPDGDTLCCEESVSAGWLSHHPTAILVHGLGGSHLSQYMIRMASKLLEHPYRTIRMNLRGCGSSIKLCRRPYHGGLSDDLWHTLRYFQARAPHSPTALIGFSLGGNICLKMAGERREALSPYVKTLIAVCPPFDLERALCKMRKHPFGIYERYLALQMRRQYEEWAAYHPEVTHPKMPSRMNISDFNNLLIAPLWDFANAEDYYRKSSCGPFIAHTAVPSYIICSADDPIVDTETLDTLKLPSSVKIWQSQYGGHMGFVGAPWETSGLRWLDGTILNLVRTHTETS